MNALPFLLAITLVVATLQSSYYFLAVKKIGLIKWFFFNTCAPWSFMFLLGLIIWFITRNKLILSLTLPGLIYFAVKGMLIFSWTRPISQLSHLIMLISSAFAFCLIFKDKPYKISLICLLVGITLLLIFNYFQTKFVSNHQLEFNQIMPVK
ncbi:hypothetical protein ACFL0Y_03490 [Patescibacteria group bacterium]